MAAPVFSGFLANGRSRASSPSAQGTMLSVASGSYRLVKIRWPIFGGEIEGIYFGCRPIPDLATVPPLKMIFLLGFPLAAIGSTEPICPAGLAPVQRNQPVTPNSWLAAAGHQETVEALLQFSGSLAMFSRKPSFNRRRLSLAPDRLQCSDSCPSE